MMSRRKKNRAGFSLIEMMIVLIVLTIIMAAIFAQMITAQQRSGVEQAKLDLFQETREFMDQMTRDLHNAGYPNPRNYGWSAGNLEIPDPAVENPKTAAGLVMIDSGDLWFEGDVIGDGQVYSVRYHLEPDGPNCPCLQRSWKPKIAGSPMDQGYDYQVEVQHVLNGSAGYSLADHPIFYAYYDTDKTNPVPLPIDSNNPLIADINTIKVMVTVQAQIHDPRTMTAPAVTLVSTVKLNNCNLKNTGNGGPLACR
jgi:prepilin-type N-terminal cleavage/methylation domain-containing protein